ncbi:MAG: M48 family metalloprotease [Bacteroidales bacterium]|nr:M48 family metalloprotease [Bacteroidales bacterium]
MKRITFIIIAFFALTTFAQPQLSVNNYAPIESQGSFPADLKKAANTPKSDKEYSPFLVSMLNQGRILYGTEMNQYLDNIKEKLLVNYPQLQQEVHVYILQSTIVNAYSLPSGTVLVTMGMLAQVTNEAELAFVLAHEIAHYSERHSKADNSKSKDKDAVSRYMRHHQFSREQEFAADRVGLLTYYKDSPYSYDILDGLFDVLLYADLPFDEIPFQRSEVEAGFYQFPDNYFLKTVANIPDRSNMIDTLLTHPNVEKRRTLANGLVSKFSNEGRKRFVQPEDQFTRLRNVARFACIDRFLINHDYDKAIYNIHVMEQHFPDNAYLCRAKATAYYGAAKHKGSGQTSSYMEPYRDVEGEQQQVNYFLSKMNRNEYAVLALRNAWTALQAAPSDEYLQNIAKDLINDIFVKNKMRFVDFCDYPQGTTLEEIAKTGGDTTRPATTNSKYDRIKQQSVNAKVLPDPKFKTVNYMLADIHSDSLFKAWVNDAVVNAEMQAVLESVSDAKIGNEKSVLVATPIYHIYDNYHHVKSSSADKRNAEHLQKLMCRALKGQKITPVTLSMDFSKPETEKYNNYVKMRQWNEDFTNAGGLDMRYHTSEYLDDIASELGSRKLCFVHVTDAPGRSFFGNKISLPWLAPIFPYSLPVVAAVLSLRQHDVDVNFRVIDVVDGKTEVSSHYSKSEVMRKAYVNGYVYQKVEDYVKPKMYNFLGNHVILNMEGYISPAWLNPNPVSSGWDISKGAQRYLGLNYFLTPNIELMVWKKGTVGVGYNYYNSPFKGSDCRLRIGHQYYGYTDWGEAELYGNIIAHGFNAYYKQYVGNRFAPLGHYFKFIFDGFFYHYKMDTEGIQIGIIEGTQEPYEEIIENKGNIFGLKIEYGYDFILLNRLKLTLGASLGTTFGGYKVPFARIKDSSAIYYEESTLRYDHYARTRILGAYCFGLKLGIGFIPF